MKVETTYGRNVSTYSRVPQIDTSVRMKRKRNANDDPEQHLTEQTYKGYLKENVSFPAEYNRQVVIYIVCCRGESHCTFIYFMCHLQLSADGQGRVEGERRPRVGRGAQRGEGEARGLRGLGRGPGGCRTKLPLHYKPCGHLRAP